MFSHIQSSANQILKKLTSYIPMPIAYTPFSTPSQTKETSANETTITELTLGDNSNERMSQFISKLHEEAMSSSTGIAIGELKDSYAKHFVYILPNFNLIPKQQVNKQLKMLMDLPEDNARLPFDIIQRLTDSSVSLAMNNSEGVQLRKFFAKYLQPQKFKIQATEYIKRILFPTSAPSAILVKCNIMDLFAKVFLNIDTLDESLREALLSIEINITPNTILLNKSASPKNLVDVKHAYDESIKQFLENYLYRSKLDYENKEYVKGTSIILDCVIEKYNKKISEISNAEINNCSSDKTIRGCISIFLAVNNISSSIHKALTQLKDNYQFCEKICEEAGLYNSSLNNKSFPYLNAFFLESLCHASPVEMIIRYTNDAVTEEGLSIPRDSIIFFNLRHCLRSFLDQGSEFNPQRFLNEDGTLNESAQLQKELLMPFGVGARLCPAVALSGVIFNTYIQSAAEHYNKYNMNRQNTTSLYSSNFFNLQAPSLDSKNDNSNKNWEDEPFFEPKDSSKDLINSIKGFKF